MQASLSQLEQWIFFCSLLIDESSIHLIDKCSPGGEGGLISAYYKL